MVSTLAPALKNSGPVLKSEYQSQYQYRQYSHHPGCLLVVVAYHPNSIVIFTRLALEDFLARSSIIQTLFSNNTFLYMARLHLAIAHFLDSCSSSRS